MTKSFEHEGLSSLEEDYPLIYTTFSKHYFYYRMFISSYVLEQGAVPLNPFMLFDYFLLDRVDRNCVRKANNSIIRRADEMWVFGPVSDGVLAEIQTATDLGKPILYFRLEKPNKIVQIHPSDVVLEREVVEFEKLFQELNQ